MQAFNSGFQCADKFPSRLYFIIFSATSKSVFPNVRHTSQREQFEYENIIYFIKTCLTIILEEGEGWGHQNLCGTEVGHCPKKRIINLVVYPLQVRQFLKFKASLAWYQLFCNNFCYSAQDLPKLSRGSSHPLPHTRSKQAL